MSTLPLRSPQLSGSQAPEARLRALLVGLGEIPPESLPALIGALEEARAALWARMMAPSNPPQRDENDPLRLFSVPEVADLMGIPKGRVYELARCGALPSVRLGKSIRFSAVALKESLDKASNQRLHYGYGRPGASPNQGAHGADAGGNGRAAGHSPRLPRPVGKRR